jgi:hypothetical protein
MKKKHPGGQPPKGAESQTERIHLRAEPAEKERYLAAAGKAGIPLAKWIKDRLNRSATRELND